MQTRYVNRHQSEAPCDFPECTRPGCMRTVVSYTLPSGEPTPLQPGDVFVSHEHEPGACPYWDNCDGAHFWCVLPNGHRWCIDSRASNCTMKDDRQHRCWVRSGDAVAGRLHVDKNGRTCQAGAGSIAVDGYHGFLHNGQLTSC